MQTSANIALEIQEIERKISSGIISAQEKFQLLSELADLYLKKYAALTREEVAAENQQKAIENASSFLDGLSEIIEPVIQNYIDSGNKKFNDILERNKDKLVFSEEELRVAREQVEREGIIGTAKDDAVRERAQQNFITSVTIEVNEELTTGYNQVKELSIGVCSAEPKTREEAMQLMFIDVSESGVLSDRNKAIFDQMSSIEKQALLIKALEYSHDCSDEEMDNFEKNLEIYQNTPSCSIRPDFSGVINFDFASKIQEYLNSSTILETPEQQKLSEIYKSLGVSDDSGLEKLNLSQEALISFADITEILRQNGNALDVNNAEYNSLNSLIADFERLAQKSREEAAALVIRK